MHICSNSTISPTHHKPRQLTYTHTLAFAKCAKEQGWMVVFKCRDENRALNKCLEQYTNQEKREEWLRAKGIEVKKK